MGSWNATCGISRLPILYGTPTVLVVIYSPHHKEIQNEHFAGFSYSTDLWRPTALPIFGTYDMYGSIEDVGQTPCLPFIEKTLVEWGGKGSGESLVNYLKQLSRGRTRAKSPLCPESPIGQMLIRRDIWDFLLTAEWDVCWGKHTKAQTEADAKEWVQFVTDYIAKCEGDSRKLFHISFEVERHFAGRGTGLFHALNFSHTAPLFYIGSKVMLALSDIGEEKLTSKEALEIMLNYGALVHINDMMTGLRTFWGPQSGAGSQDTGWELYNALADKVSEIARKGLKEESGEDEDAE